MLLAQINRDSQGMTEFPGGGMEAQHVTLCLTEAVTVADGDNLENMEGVSLQAVTLADGSTAYIQHNSKDGKLIDGQVIQLEDGSAAYVQHVPIPKSTGDSLRLEDGQAVQLEDGTTAFIHHTSKVMTRVHYRRFSWKMAPQLISTTQCKSRSLTPSWQFRLMGQWQ
ncbi:ZNF143 isoform 10, partial [Pongo abelii]